MSRINTAQNWIALRTVERIKRPLTAFKNHTTRDRALRDLGEVLGSVCPAARRPSRELPNQTLSMASKRAVRPS